MNFHPVNDERLDQMAAWLLECHKWLSKSAEGPSFRVNPDDLNALIAGLKDIGEELAFMAEHHRKNKNKSDGKPTYRYFQ